MKTLRSKRTLGTTPGNGVSKFDALSPNYNGVSMTLPNTSITNGLAPNSLVNLNLFIQVPPSALAGGSA